MKQMRRWLALALVLLLTVGLLPLQAQAATKVVAKGKCGSKATWTLDSAGTLTVSGTGAMWNYTQVAEDNPAPWNSDENQRQWEKIKKLVIQKGITSVGSYAFYQCSALSSVSLPNTLTKIGTGAFGNVGDSIGDSCSRLTAITIPNGVTAIGSGAFAHSGLRQVVLPNTVTAMGKQVFQGCSLTTVTLSNGLSVLDEGTFCWSGVKSLVIPRSIQRVKQLAFFECRNLTSVTIQGDGVKIEPDAFLDSSNLKTIRFSGNAPVISAKGFEGVKATVYYPANNPTWKSVINKNYGGKLKWATWDPAARQLLGTPMLSSVTGDNSGITLKWTAVTGAAGYQVFGKTTGKWQKLGVTTGTSFKWTKAVSGKQYSFTVRCISKNKEFTSGYDSIGKSILYLRIPAISSLKNDKAGTVTASWKAVSGANGYQVIYSTDPNMKPKTRTSRTVKGATSVALAGLKKNQVYYFSVRSYKTVNGKTSYSAWGPIRKGTVKK